MIISAIAARSRNHAIGRNNQLPWRMPADLKFFKQTTLHHTVLMGRKSFESLGRPLPHRRNIILTRDTHFAAPEGCEVFSDIHLPLQQAEARGEQEVFILGGGQIYHQTLPLWTRIYLTEIDTVIPDADTFFPEFDPAQWHLLSHEPHLKDAQNPFDYTFKVWEKDFLNEEP